MKDGMRKSRLSCYKQERLIEHFISDSTARCAAELIGVSKSTAAYYFQRLREILAYQCEQESHEVFDGEIELDESYFGGRRKGHQRQRLLPPKPSGATLKVVYR